MAGRAEQASGEDRTRRPRGCSCAKLRRATRCLTQAYDQALRPSGLRVTQYSVLATIDGGDPLSVSQLAERLVMDRTTLTRNLRPMQQAGWVEIGPGTDRRSRGIRITAAGRARLEAARPLWQAAEQAFRARLGADDAAALHRLLDVTVREASEPLDPDASDQRRPTRPSIG